MHADTVIRSSEKEDDMPARRVITASVWREGEWYVAQALDTDVASQGESVEDALANLREALELHFESPVPTAVPELRRIEVDVAAD